MAISADQETTARRLRAAREAVPGCWLGLDAAWIFNEVDDAVAFARAIEDVGLAWFEDVFPPGDAEIVRRLREKIPTPVAMGDEQGGSYYPEALLLADAVDVVRIDLTCMGGITRGKQIVAQCEQAGKTFAAAHVRPRAQPGLLRPRPHGVPIEWGVPWTGVDPYADSLRQPVILDGGLMAPLAEAPGFGELLNREWALSQPHDDPDHILG